MESLFVNDLLLQNAYYKCLFINYVWIIIPILQMLTQMNIKEGNNRISKPLAINKLPINKNHCSFSHHNWGIDKSKPLFVIFIYFQETFFQWRNNKDEKYTIMM